MNEHCKVHGVVPFQEVWSENAQTKRPTPNRAEIAKTVADVVNNM